MVVICVWMVLTMTSAVFSWSTLDKSDKYYNFYAGTAKTLQGCKDNLDSSTCKSIVASCDRKEVKELCKRTCGECPAVSPMSCKGTLFGCCWDKVTISGPNGEGCPVCADTTAACFKVMRHCDEPNIRRKCPKTCNVEDCYLASSDCHDDPQQRDFCDLFKQSGLCKDVAEVCKRTCDLCDKDRRTVSVNPKSVEDDDALIKKLEQQVKDELDKSELASDELPATMTKKNVKLDQVELLEALLDEKRSENELLENGTALKNDRNVVTEVETKEDEKPSDLKKRADKALIDLILKSSDDEATRKRVVNGVSTKDSAPKKTEQDEALVELLQATAKVKKTDDVEKNPLIAKYRQAKKEENDALLKLLEKDTATKVAAKEALKFLTEKIKK